MMIKKRYLMILSLAIVSVLLGSLLYNHLVLAGKPAADVNVVNFPLDEEGNLRVAEMNGEQNVTVTNLPARIEPKTITVVQNHTVTSTGTGWTPIATANVTGYRCVTIFVAYYNDNSDQDLSFEPSCQGISANSWTVGLQLNNGYYETGGVRFEVGAPELTFRVYSYSAGTIELTILLYYYN